jgi:hypothetical protein
MSQPAQAPDATTPASNQRQTGLDDQRQTGLDDQRQTGLDDQRQTGLDDQRQTGFGEPQQFATRRTADDEPLRAPSDGNLAPGQPVNDPVAALWGTDLVEQYRSQWRDLQLTFVDDPKRATDAAASLVDDAVTSLTSTLQAQKQSLDGWRSTRDGDTEVMRVALRSYRGFLDRLLGI